MISPPDGSLYYLLASFFLAGAVSLGTAVAMVVVQKRPLLVPLIVGAGGVLSLVIMFVYAQITLPGFWPESPPTARIRPLMGSVAVLFGIYAVGLYIAGDREQKMADKHARRLRLNAEMHADEMEARRNVSEKEKAILQSHIDGLITQNATQKEQFQELKRLILTNVSHELRTPITYILGFIPMIIDGTFGQVINTPLEEPLQTVHTSTRRLFSVVKRMLFATLRDPSFEQVDLATVCEQALRDEDIWLNTRRERSEVTITSDIPAKLVVTGDLDMLKVSVTELLNNAIKFNATAIRLALFQQDKGEVVIQIGDNGIGVPRKHHRDIFDPHFQVRMDSRRPFEGTGNGLAAVANVARKHHGHVFVQNQPGQKRGAILSMIIPAQQAGVE